MKILILVITFRYDLVAVFGARWTYDLLCKNAIDKKTTPPSALIIY